MTATTSLAPAGRSAGVCRRGERAPRRGRRRSECRAQLKNASRLAGSGSGCGSNDIGVFPQVGSEKTGATAMKAWWVCGYNDPLNKTDPLGLRPSDDSAFSPPECRTSPFEGFAAGGPPGQGFFDRNRADAVMRLRPYIDKWAGINGIDSFTLAVLIHHEGGNYLDPWRRGAAQGIDYAKLGAGAAGLGSASVGIAGVQVGTAQEVLGSVYCDSGYSDFEIGSALIESDEFSISIAAGYLSELKSDFPSAPNRGLFLAYAASTSAIGAMEQYDWNLQDLARAIAAEAYTGGDPSDVFGISVGTLEILLRREDHWFSSSNAMREAGW